MTGQVGGQGLADGDAADGEIEFTFAGQTVRASHGQTVAMALWTAGCLTLRNSSKLGSPRGILCNMGICYECLVRIGGESVRACMTEVREGLVVERGGRP